MYLGKRSYVCAVVVVALYLMTASVSVAQTEATDKAAHDHRLFSCLEDELKSKEFGCQLLAKVQVSQFSEGPLFWHVNRLQTRETAEAANNQAGTVVEAEGKFWLFSFGRKNDVPKQGELVASVGPLDGMTQKQLHGAKLYLTEFDTVWNASAPEHGLRSARRG